MSALDEMEYMLLSARAALSEWHGAKRNIKIMENFVLVWRASGNIMMCLGINYCKKISNE